MEIETAKERCERVRVRGKGGEEMDREKGGNSVELFQKKLKRDVDKIYERTEKEKQMFFFLTFFTFPLPPLSPQRSTHNARRRPFLHLPLLHLPLPPHSPPHARLLHLPDVGGGGLVRPCAAVPVLLLWVCCQSCHHGIRCVFGVCAGDARGEGESGSPTLFSETFSLLILSVSLFSLFLSQVAFFLPLSLPVFSLHSHTILQGNFRFAHIRIRVCAESIAFYRAHEKEKEITNTVFSLLLSNRRLLILWHFLLSLSSNLFTYSATLVNYSIVAASLMLAPSHLEEVLGTDVTSSGVSSSSEISSYIALTSFNLIMLASGFSSLTNISTPVADLAGYTARIAELLSALDQIREVRSKYNVSDDQLDEDESRDVSFGGVPITDSAFREDSNDSLKILIASEISPLMEREGFGKEKEEGEGVEGERVEGERRERALLSADPFSYAGDDDVIEFSNVSCEPIFRSVR